MRAFFRLIWASLPFAGFIFGLTFWIWLFAQPGTLGSFKWSYGRPTFFLVASMFLMPLVLAIAGRYVQGLGKGSWVLHTASGWGILAGGLAIFLFVWFYGSATTPIPRLEALGPILIEPVAGISAHPHPGLDAPLLRVALSSDPHVDKDNADHDATKRILAQVGSGDYDAFFPLGDTTEFGMYGEGWALARSWFAAGLGVVPVRPIMGNHDTIFAGAVHYRQAFFPDGMKSDSGSPYYYSVDAGPVCFVVINLPWGTEDFDATQRHWLEQTLATMPPGKQIVVLSHCFIYSSGVTDPGTGMPWFDHPDTTREIAPILERYKVSLSVSGHNHQMEYLRHAGVSYAVIGTFGGFPDPEPDHLSPATLWHQNGVFGFLELAAWPDRLELSYIDSNGQTLHQERVANPRL